MNINFKTTLILCLLTALQSSQASSIPLPTPIAQQSSVINFSKIRKLSEIKKFPEFQHYRKHNYPKVALYTLSNKKELWFFLEIHYRPQWVAFTETLINNENFTHGIIEQVTTSPNWDSFTSVLANAKENNDPYFKNSSMGRALVLLIQQKKVVKPGEYVNFEEAFHALEQEGLSLKDIEYIENIEEHERSGSIIEKKVMDLYIELSEKEALTRDKKLIQTIIETMKDEAATKVLVIYGAGHWFKLEKLLKEHFGNPEMISFNQYKIEQQILQLPIIIMKKIEQILQLPIITTLLDMYMFHRL